MRNYSSLFNITLISLIISFVSQSPAFSQTGRKTEIKQIDAYVKSLNFTAKQKPEPDLIYADVSDYDKQKPRWKRFSSTSSLEKFRTETDIYNSANNWRKSGNVVLSVVTLSSPSGDWAKYLYMYFRNDGTLAKSESELRTFYGDFVAKQNFYFDRKGRLIKKTLKYFDLATGKLTKPDRANLADNLSFINNDNYYKKVTDLPFADLIPR